MQVDLTKTEIRKILRDLDKPFLYELDMKKPAALAWARLNEKLEKALRSSLGGRNAYW